MNPRTEGRGRPSHSHNTFLDSIPFVFRDSDGGLEGELEVVDHLLVPGHDQVRISVLASVADVITGLLVARSAPPSTSTLTVDLAVRLLKPSSGRVMPMRSRLVKQGRTLSVAEAWFFDDDQPTAHAWATFMSIPLANPIEVPASSTSDQTHVELQEPFADSLGLSVTEPGVVELEHRPYILQPTGTVHGGVVAAMAEIAAESLTGQRVTQLDVRYLSTVRIGPARAVAELLGEGLARVRGADAGRDDDRTASMTFTRFST